VKLYIDDIDLKDLLELLIRLPRLLLDVVKEEWFWWTKLYKYEIYLPDWEKDHDEGLRDSFKRIRRQLRIKSSKS